MTRDKRIKYTLKLKTIHSQIKISLQLKPGVKGTLSATNHMSSVAENLKRNKFLPLKTQAWQHLKFQLIKI